MRDLPHSRRAFLRFATGAVAAQYLFATNDGDSTLTNAEVEKFLVDGKMVSSKTLGVGITQSVRATISCDGLVHDAHIQCIDESKALYQTPSGTEMNFRDCWMFNIAAYRLDEMLEGCVASVRTGS